ncbi:MAG TPA: serine/threonine-protein kinase [Kofleriaceae bacterium]|nr:serine/threonine-protein kinase [Kofleriaceae bacterium]
MEHLDDNAASEFVSGTLSPSALGRAEGHLASCRECRALVAALAADPATDSAAVTFQRLISVSSVSQLTELPRRAPSSGDRVGRYLVLSALGAGGMGVVFAAWDPQLGRKIALKLLRSSLAMSSKDARTRLRREAQAIAQLSHPHVVSVYDVGTTDDGALYIAMEFVEGDTLTSWLRTYPRSWREIVDVFRQAARGLLAAHGVGLLHRDFKPDNVLVGGDGRVRVTDFGLARSVLIPDEAAQAKPVMSALDVALTATGTVLGTPRYMPPEQLTGPGPDLDARSDQFSFCVALYEALYGVHPLRGGTSVAMLDDGERAKPPPDGSKVPPAIGRAVLRGLERDRARRFPSMGALIDELEVRPRRSPLRFAALATAAVLIAGGTTAAVVAQQRPPPEPAPDFTTVDGLVAERERQDAEIKRLADELALAHAEITELGHARSDALGKDAEIARLGGVVVQLQTALWVARARATRIASGQLPVPVIVTDPADPAVIAIRGCFFEWDDRNGSDATIVVAVTVTPDGAGTSPRIISTPDQHPIVPGDDAGRGMSMLEMCVSEQVGRLKFPRSSEQLEVEETIRWSQGRVAVVPKLVGHRDVPLRRIELP